MSRALIIVDVQPTFCEEGSLAVAGGNDIASKIADYAIENDDVYDIIIATQDWHIDPAGHFSETPDFIDTWPVHGVAGSEEAELHPALGPVRIDYALKKGEYEAAYSGFEGQCPGGSTLEEILDEEGITEVDIVGLALSHCVKETALDATKLDWLDHIRVITDLSVPVSAELGQAALQKLSQTRVELVTALN